ncbi:MAG: hypothetical protein ABI600_04215 [Luteolibacter sp.]
MNTNPDEATLALWLDDELEGEQLAALEAWAMGHPEHIAARLETRHWRSLMASAIPAVVEPPYPEFFNSRIAHAIREQASKGVTPGKRWFVWQSLLMPLSVCAGMALAFWLGTKTQGPPEIDVTGAPRAIPVEQLVYTPENGVNAELYASGRNSPTVIVLNGVRAIPDAMDFSQTTNVPMGREIDSTAQAGDPVEP